MNGARNSIYLVWDWNGTLLDDVEACVNAINRMMARRNLGRLEVPCYRRIFQFPVKEYYRVLGFDLANENWDSMAREFHADYAETSVGAGLRPGAHNLLEDLGRQGVGMSILSASERNVLMRGLKALDAELYFEHIYGLDDLYAASKSAIGKRLMEQLGHPPEDVWLVGDTDHDYEVARDIGCRCVLLDGGHQARPRLEACGCPVLNDLSEIPDFLRSV